MSGLASKGGAIPESNFSERDFTAGYGLEREVASWGGVALIVEERRAAGPNVKFGARKV